MAARLHLEPAKRASMEGRRKFGTKAERGAGGSRLRELPQKHLPRNACGDDRRPGRPGRWDFLPPGAERTAPLFEPSGSSLG